MFIFLTNPSGSRYLVNLDQVTLIANGMVWLVGQPAPLPFKEDMSFIESCLGQYNGPRWGYGQGGVRKAD